MIYWRAVIRFDNVTFTYPGASQPALRAVSLHIPASELCLVIGPSGAGKSTLLRCTNGLVPHFSGGALQGSILVNGLDPVRLSPQRMSSHVGFVFQDPEAQFVVDRVEDEIAFALENAAIPPTEMTVRVEEALALLELQPLRKRRLETLSGGERQRVAIAAALALRPQVLVLDEPTSQLDPHAAEEVLQALLRLNRELGLTVLLAEHRLERVLPFARLVVYLDNNQPGVISGPPRDVMRQVDINPPLVTLGKALGWEPLPLTVEEARQFAIQNVRVGKSDNMNIAASQVSRLFTLKTSGKSAFIEATEIEVSYGSLPVLRSVSLDLWPGEITVLMGPNGAGKTTLLRTMVGLVRPQKGHIRVAGQEIAGRQVAEICRQVGYLPQDPNALLFADTVMEELQITLRNHARQEAALGRRFSPNIEEQPATGVGDASSQFPSSLLKRLGLAGKASAYPRDLSAGERQRVALGAVTVARPGALLLDEPTRGLDYAAKHALVGLLRGWRNEGMAILLVTHDVELAAAAADQVVLMEDGRVTASGNPCQALAGSPRFTPQIARLFPGAGWLTVEDALHGLST